MKIMLAAVPVVLAFWANACTPPDPDRAGRTGAAGTAAPLPTSLWIDVTEEVLDSTAGWTNKVELADLDGDGRLDLLFANGGDYSTPGDPEMNRAFLNRIDDGSGRFEDATGAVFGDVPDLTRVLKVRDLDGDGLVDVFVGNSHQTQSRLFLGVGGGGFDEATAERLPRMPLSVGDAEAGDVDGDGDLDLVLADWGLGNSMTNDGGRVRLWRNEAGRFRDVTESTMPATRIRFSWDMELVDVDNDLDLDVLVSCKRCAASVLFRNEGGVFEEDRRGLPQYTNNYELEAMDLDGDGYLDLVTINDGDVVGGIGSSRREHVFRNDGEGRFQDVTDGWWPDAENTGEDDNVVAYLDFDSDGDADFLIGSLSGPDRLMINEGLADGEGAGRLRVASAVFSGAETPGTLGMSIGDVDGDGRIDVVQSQGEHPTAVQERVFSGRGLMDDTQPPVVELVTVDEAGDGELRVRARIHDRKSPVQPTDWEDLRVEYDVMDAPGAVEMTWYGGYLWWATVPGDAHDIRVCATDAAGNLSCAAAGG